MYILGQKKRMTYAMEHNRIGSRQIHLDFHTSELISGIGSRYSPDVFADTLKNAHVDSVTLFTRCHHGMLYHDSKRFPEAIHPGLVRRDFLESQVEACHAHGIDVNLYTTVCWDKRAADEHPEWVCIDENGMLMDYKGAKYFEAGFYKNLCVNTPYRDYLKAQFGEAIRTIPAEGVWFDAAFIVECCCPTCIKKMKELRLDPKLKQDRVKFSLITYKDMADDLSRFVRQINPKFNICYNKGHVGVREKAVQDGYTYYAFESLPGGEWGYMDFPISAKYNRNFGRECLGMTGRFHTEWGDFHSFRNKYALEFECYSMLANGCKCIIGDQLPPSGELSPFMYRQIGALFADIEMKRPWCDDASAVVEAAVFTQEEFNDAVIAGMIPRSTEGAARLLTELSIQYDILDSQSGFERYKLLVLPDDIPVDQAFALKLEEFVRGGGKLIATYRAGLNPEGTAFALDLGVNYLGDSPYSPDFVLPKGDLGAGMPESEHVMYQRGALVETTICGRTLIDAIKPVFNREWEHFCSHLHSPSSGEVGYPAVVESKAGLYFMHPIFSQYQGNGTPWCKTLIKNALLMLLPDRLVCHDGPSSLISNVMAQQAQNRWVLHLLHYIPERKCDTLDIVDNLIPLNDLCIGLHVPGAVESVCIVPDGQPLEFAQDIGQITFTLPKLTGHAMIEIQFS